MLISNTFICILHIYVVKGHIKANILTLNCERDMIIHLYSKVALWGMMVEYPPPTPIEFLIGDVLIIVLDYIGNKII